MIALLLQLLLLFLVFGAVYYIITLIPLPHPFPMIAQAVLALVLVLILIDMLLGFGALRTGLFVRP